MGQCCHHEVWREYSSSHTVSRNTRPGHDQIMDDPIEPLSRPWKRASPALHVQDRRESHLPFSSQLNTCALPPAGRRRAGPLIPASGASGHFTAIGARSQRACTRRFFFEDQGVWHSDSGQQMSTRTGVSGSENVGKSFPVSRALRRSGTHRSQTVMLGDNHFPDVIWLAFGNSENNI